MNNARIQAIMLANGFKLKDQGEGRLDLNPYVYDAAQALLGISSRSRLLPAWPSCQ